MGSHAQGPSQAAPLHPRDINSSNQPNHEKHLELRELGELGVQSEAALHQRLLHLLLVLAPCVFVDVDGRVCGGFSHGPDGPAPMAADPTYLVSDRAHTNTQSPIPSDWRQADVASSVPTKWSAANSAVVNPD